MTVLREGLLRGRSVGLVGNPDTTMSQALAGLGARVAVCAEAADEAQTEDWARAHAPLDGLVFCAEETFGRGGPDALRNVLEQAWTAIHAISSIALIPAGRHGKLVLLAPRRQAGSFATAASAALENLARTLSVEWARYGITATAIVPGPSSRDRDLAELACYFLSAAGDYFSGCQFEVGIAQAI